MTETPTLSTNSKRRTFLKLLGATGASSAVPLGAGSAAAREGHGGNDPIETVFSYPTLNGVPDESHEKTVITLLEQAVPGSDVHLTTFTFTRMNVARAFVDAAERGVNVNLVIDENSLPASATQYLLEELEDSVSITVDGGVGDNNNHNKFLLVEELEDGDTDVVWQSSSNFTNTQLHLHNTSLVFRNDVDLYDAYRSYWEDLEESEENLDYNRTEETDSTTVYFSPRSDFDTYLEALEAVNPTEDSTIRFIQSIWTTFRLGVVERVAELVDQGCTVQVILDEEGSSVGGYLQRAGVDVLQYPYYTHETGPNPDQVTNVHSKTMLIDAEFDAGDGETERRKVVYTGSQNLSGPGLTRNDETFLRIEDDDVYRKFVRDWERVFRQGARARRRLEQRAPPAPSSPHYPNRLLEDTFDTDDKEYTPFVVGGEEGAVTVEDGQFKVSGDDSFHTMFRSSVSPTNAELTVVIEPSAFIETTSRYDAFFVGLVKDEANYVVTWYDNTRLDTGYDVVYDGSIVSGGIESGLSLDTNSRLSFVLSDDTVSEFADRGDGWDHQFTSEFGTVDLTDPDVRNDYTVGFGVLGVDGAIAFDRLEAWEAR